MTKEKLVRTDRRRNMTKLFILFLSLIARIPELRCHVATAGGLVVLEGRSITLPCPYEPQYANYVKYWCQGSTREFCTSLARTDQSNADEDKVSIVDDQVQLVSTVTMKQLKEADSGWYMCGVEIGSGWTADVATFMYVTVIHGLSILNNQLRGEEGSQITFDCLYSERYRQTEKKWCRAGDWSSCVVTGSDGWYRDASVAVNDDRIGSVAVTLEKLQKEHAGWYWCVAGQHKLHVHLQVTPRTTPAESLMSANTNTTTTTTTTAQTGEQTPPRCTTKQQGSSHIWEAVLASSCVMLLVITAILATTFWHSHRYTALEQQTRLKQTRWKKAGMDRTA